MSDTILVPLDGSELSEGILAPVEVLLQAGPLDVVLLRVVPPANEPQSELEEELDRAEARQTELAEGLRGKGHTVTTRLERGDPADRILAAAQELQPEFVAMATHGRTGVTRLVRGSVAERVLRHCPAPLLLCNPQAVEAARAGGSLFRRILVPHDGSRLADRILPLVGRLAGAFGSEVVLLRVEPYIYSAVPSPVLQETWDAEAVARTLEPERRRLAEAGVPVRVEAAYGIEAAEILKAADQADLVAMSTHGRSGISRWWFGSVAEQVVRHCARPLLVLRVVGEED